MAYKLVVLSNVAGEIKEALLWHEEQKKGLGKKLNTEIKQVFTEILKDPDLFQKRYRNVRIRFLKKFKYGIHYEIKGELIVVFAVIHTARKPRK